MKNTASIWQSYKNCACHTDTDIVGQKKYCEHLDSNWDSEHESGNGREIAVHGLGLATPTFISLTFPEIIIGTIYSKNLGKKREAQSGGENKSVE